MGADQSQGTQAFTPEFADGEVASRRRRGIPRFSRTDKFLLAGFFGAWAGILVWGWLS